MNPRFLTLRASDGRPVPAKLRVPKRGPVAGVAILCHPHPAFGGSMDVWLLPRIAVRLAGAGWAALRFNFRDDVGDGRAAVPDLAAAVDAAASWNGAAAGRLALVGWSLGALVGLLYGPSDERVTDWVGIAPPSRPAPDGWPAQPLAPVPPDLGAWNARRTVVVADHEQFYPAADAEVFAPDAVLVVADADHFFFDRDDEITDIVVDVLTTDAR